LKDTSTIIVFRPEMDVPRGIEQIFTSRVLKWNARTN